MKKLSLKSIAAKLLTKGLHFRNTTNSPFYGEYYSFDDNGNEISVNYRALELINDIDSNFPLTVHCEKTGASKNIGALSEKLTKQLNLK